MTSSPVRRARRAAEVYRERWGWNPLPSDIHEKRPLGPYAHLWDAPADPSAWRATSNLQIVTGVRWGLAVVDLDGEAGRRAWESMSLYRPVPRTWTVRTPRGNWHLWFGIPSGVASLPKRCLWEGGRHERIDLLGDRSLVMAPPSLDPETGRRYEFLVGPADMPTPAPLPMWVVDHPGTGRCPVPIPFAPPKPAPIVSLGHSYDWRDVLSAIPDKPAVAFGWGLRLTGRVSAAEWLECRAIGREDRTPSAGIHRESGHYVEPGEFHLSLFDLGVAFGKYRTWWECCNDLGHRYLFGGSYANAG